MECDTCVLQRQGQNRRVLLCFFSRTGYPPEKILSEQKNNSKAALGQKKTRQLQNKTNQNTKTKIKTKTTAKKFTKKEKKKAEADARLGGL